jgi:hypothetical protein
MIPDDPNVLLTRKVAAAALAEAGFPVAEKTLATKATRGGGPPFQKFGPRALYRWGDALQWRNLRPAQLLTSGSRWATAAAASGLTHAEIATAPARWADAAEAAIAITLDSDPIPVRRAGAIPAQPPYRGRGASSIA